MLDLSLSMPMRDNFLAAKKVAMALHSLISTQFPRDYLGIVGFSEVARELKPREAARGVVGLRLRHQHAARLPCSPASMLARQSGTKQIIMITDGEPTAHITAHGEPFFHYPPVPETIDATLAEVDALHPRGHPHQHVHARRHAATCSSFVEKLTQLNRGRAFFTTPETLGDYVLVDFIEQRRQLIRGDAAPADRRRAAELSARPSRPRRSARRSSASNATSTTVLDRSRGRRGRSSTAIVGRGVLGIAVDAGARWPGTRPTRRAELVGDLEAAPVARRQQLGLAVRRRRCQTGPTVWMTQRAGSPKPGVALASPVAQPPERPALVEQLGPGGPVDGSVDPAAAEQRRVGGVDDGVDGERRDVGPHRLDLAS